MPDNISPLFENDFTQEQADVNAQNQLFSSGFNSELNAILNPQGLPSADMRTASSDLGVSLQPTPIGESPGLFNPALVAEVNRTKGKNISETAIPKKQDGKVVSSLEPIMAGFRSSQQFQLGESGDPVEAGIGVGTSVLGGVVSGALSGAAIGSAGGPIGAGTGAVVGGLTALVISGAKAWFSVRSARKKNRALKELEREANKQRLEDIARIEKWDKINQFNNVRDAKANREQQLLQNKWEIYSKVAQNMTSLINSDAALNQQMKNQMRGA